MIKTSVVRRSPLLFIFITVFVDLLGYGMVIPLLPFYVTRQSGGAAVAGALGSVYALMQLLSGPQALFSLTMILGPTMASLSFERLGTSAPYWLGGLLAAAALLIAHVALRRSASTD